MAKQFRLELAGECAIPVWGLPSETRIRRLFKASGLEDGGSDAPALWIDVGFAFDPLWLRHMVTQPDTVLRFHGRPVIAHLASGEAKAAFAAEQAGQGPAAGLTTIEHANNPQIYNQALRKLDCPMLDEIRPERMASIHRRIYLGTYKGVTDVLTKYLWPEWALVLTRIAARIGMSPNQVTAIGAFLCVAATVAFWYGHFWAGMAMGLGFMVLDTVDGKLARCTVTSSKWGNVFDHGIDLVHPPFWWYAWGVGLGAWGLALSTQTFALVMAAIVAGYVLQRVIEGLFIKWYGMDIHVWGKVDSDFRLVTARRNPNMVILFGFTLVARPDLGLIAVAVWTVLSLVFHAVRLLQAMAAPKPIRSWMEA